MKRILCAVLLAVVMATPAFAARVYLKEGGFIQAKRVWRADGRVYVLATRHTLTSFAPREINMKRTFVKRHQPAKSVKVVQSQPKTTATAPAGAVANKKKVK